MSADVEILWARGASDVEAALALREQVFCVEQGVPREEELDQLDDEALHLLALEPGSERVVGTLRLLLHGSDAKIGRVAVAAERRRGGIASQMLERALARARVERVVRVRLAAQLVAVALYEQAGFAVESEQFEEAGIAHVWMGRSLAPPAGA
jgi:predicted GNAT family N-acyltransferase